MPVQLQSNGDPYTAPVLPTQSDTVDDPNGPFRGISFAVAGAVKIRGADNTDVVIPSAALAIGTIHSLRVKRVWTTGTTATGIVCYS